MNPSTIDSRYLCYLLDYFYSFLSKCLSVFEEVSANRLRHTSLILRDIAWKRCRSIKNRRISRNLSHEDIKTII